MYRETAMNGFVGCVRQLVMSGIQILPRDLMDDDLTILTNDNRPRTGSVINHNVLVDACEMFDRCTPNPCRHGGICYQVKLFYLFFENFVFLLLDMDKISL
jgi:hypothetical protein